MLRGRGERLTRPRMALLRALVALADDHPTADRLLAAARVTDPDLAESSLYRGLEWLESAGIAQHSHFGHGPAVWHRVGDERLHLLCERCGVVQHVPASALRASFRRLVQTYGFTPLPHHFAISGLCGACGTDGLS
ncbi:MAG: transcriptional repressor [Acidimicrobiales bacterium]